MKLRKLMFLLLTFSALLFSCHDEINCDECDETDFRSGGSSSLEIDPKEDQMEEGDNDEWIDSGRSQGSN